MPDLTQAQLAKLAEVFGWKKDKERGWVVSDFLSVIHPSMDFFIHILTHDDISAVVKGMTRAQKDCYLAALAPSLMSLQPHGMVVRLGREDLMNAINATVEQKLLALAIALEER